MLDPSHMMMGLLFPLPPKNNSLSQGTSAWKIGIQKKI